MSSKQYELVKSLWTESDFENMGWHDSHIYGISFGQDFQLDFDIDYIFKWVLTGKTYHFWVSPCTLSFQNVYETRFELSPKETGIDIDNIGFSNPQRPKNVEFIGRETEFDWSVETHQGLISFKSVGYKQYVRQAPKYLASQLIGLTERGGVSFDKTEIGKTANKM